MMLLHHNFRLQLATVDNNDTDSYGCIMVALELQPYERKMQPSKKELDKLGFDTPPN